MAGITGDAAAALPPARRPRRPALHRHLRSHRLDLERRDRGDRRAHRRARRPRPAACWAARCSLWVLAKFVRRWLFLRELRIARITPEELKERMDSGEAVVVVDLRHSADVERVGREHPRRHPHRHRRHRERPRSHPARSRDHPLLYVTERSDQRPGGAAASQAGGEAGPASRGRLRCLVGPRLPGRVIAGRRLAIDLSRFPCRARPAPPTAWRRRPVCSRSCAGSRSPPAGRPSRGDTTAAHR